MNEIRKNKERLYALIKSAEDGLKELREKCPHENTFEGNYMYRIGATFRALICEDCGECLKSLDPEIMEHE